MNIPGAPHPLGGSTVAEIMDSVRSAVDAGELAPGAGLPPVRALAEMLGVNRNTVATAYSRLAAAGVVVARGRRGTVVAEPVVVHREGTVPVGGRAARTSSPDGAPHLAPGVRDLASGNPDPRRLPDLTRALTRAAREHSLYGAPAVHPELRAVAVDLMGADLHRAGVEGAYSVTHGAADAIERLLAAHLVRGDEVAIEEPCSLATLAAVRAAGHVPVGVPVDAEGMTVAGLRAALGGGARAVVVTPRAQSATGVSLSPVRAEALRTELAAHPHVVVIEDDHFALLSPSRHVGVLGAPGVASWALVRSVTEALGPDLRVAVVASDADTADRLAVRLDHGYGWVSHLLQEAVADLLGSRLVRRRVDAAGARYAERHSFLVDELRRRNLEAMPGEGLNVWVRVPGYDEDDVVGELARRGWLVRAGRQFAVAPDGEVAATAAVRVTIATAELAELREFAEIIGALCPPG